VSPADRTSPDRARQPRQQTGAAVVLAYAKPHWRVWLLLTILTFASMAATLAQPWVVKLLIDRVFDGNGSPSTRHVLIAAAALSGVALFGVASAIEHVQMRTWVRVGYTMVYDLAATVFSIIQRQSLRYHRQHSVGDTIGRVALDSWCIYRVVETCILIPGRAVLMTIVTVVVMLPLDLGLTLTTLMAAPIMASLNALLGRRARVNAKATREIESALQAHVHQTLTGIDVVQAFAAEDHQRERFQQFAGLAIRAQRRGAFLTSISDLATGAVTTLGTAGVLLVGSRHVLAGRIGVGSLVVFLAYLATMYEQMKSGISAYLSLQGLGGQIDHIVEVIQSEPDLPERADARPLGTVRGEVRVEDVTVGYAPGRPALKGISLIAEAGQTVAIVGRTGAGKSTLVNLVPRFLDPWEGRVTIDGHDLRDLGMHDLREHVALVLQEPFLFPISIADNIRLARPRATSQQVIAAARAARAENFIRRLPDGYDTIIGERGATLSGGERQRLAIARALLKDAPILILDEPTSAVDSATEQQLLDALTTLMRGRTTFLIAHRLSTVRHADRILVLDDGRIAERGTHDELLGRRGLYAEMCDRASSPLPAAAGAGR
jgi:ABC-type multidrug transport system fused ATPase/permease subunit